MKVADALAPSIPRGPSSPPLAPDGLVSVGVVLLLLAWEASQPRAQQHGGRSTCASAVVGPADFTLAWGQSGERKADKDEYDLEEAWLHLQVCALWTATDSAVSSLAENSAMGMKSGRTAVCISTGPRSVSCQLGEPENLYSLLRMSTLMTAAKEEWQTQGHERWWRVFSPLRQTCMHVKA